MIKKRPKYGNKKVEYQGQLFDSKREMQRYVVLKEAEEKGLISDLRTQVTFELIPAITEEYVEHLKTKDKIKTRVLQRAVTYKADFVYIKDGEEIIEDVKISKALIPKEFALKEKIFFWKYGKRIQLVFNANDTI
mgnify:FL=1